MNPAVTTRTASVPAARPAAARGEPGSADTRSVRTVQVADADIDDRLVTLKAPTSFAAAQYRNLSYSLRADRPDLHMLAVCSPCLGDGKSTTAINLAGALARDGGSRVLVVDADLRRPSVGPMLGLAARPGLGDLLEDPSLELGEVVVDVPSAHLSVLPAGRRGDDVYRAFQSRRWGHLLAGIRGHYNSVIVDTPPLLLVPDGRVIAAAADGVLLVVAAHRTRRSFLEEALSALASAKVAGIVFNGDDRSPARYGRQYGAYYTTSRNGS